MILIIVVLMSCSLLYGNQPSDKAQLYVDKEAEYKRKQKEAYELSMRNRYRQDRQEAGSSAPENRQSSQQSAQPNRAGSLPPVNQSSSASQMRNPALAPSANPAYQKSSQASYNQSANAQTASTNQAAADAQKAQAEQEQKARAEQERKAQLEKERLEKEQAAEVKKQQEELDKKRQEELKKQKAQEIPVDAFQVGNRPSVKPEALAALGVNLPTAAGKNPLAEAAIILGIPYNSDKDTIKKAYRALITKWRNSQDPASNDVQILLNWANETLTK